MTRRRLLKTSILVSGVATPGIGAMPANAPSGKIVVLGPLSNPAYQDTISEILGQFQTSGAEFVTVEVRGDHGSGELEKAMATSPRLVVAVGSEATEWMSRSKSKVPVISTMTLRAPARFPALVGVVPLEVPLPAVLAKLKQYFPSKTKLGVLFNPASGLERTTVLTDCSRAGFRPEISDCAAPGDLVPQFLSLRERRIDLVLCFADNVLYSGATIKPLVLASLEQRIGLVGFSAAFVRAGAVIGVYADLKASGRQTAAAALRYLESRTAVDPEGPRTVKVGINQRVARLIGLEFRDKDSEEVVIFR